MVMSRRFVPVSSRKSSTDSFSLNSSLNGSLATIIETLQLALSQYLNIMIQISYGVCSYT
jgi:hypothetical protein